MTSPVPHTFIGKDCRLSDSHSLWMGRCTIKLVSVLNCLDSTNKKICIYFMQLSNCIQTLNRLYLATMKILPMRTVLQEWIYHLSTHPTILPGQSKRCLGTKKRYLLKRIHCSVVVLPQFKDSENLVSGCLLEHKANS